MTIDHIVIIVLCTSVLALISTVRGLRKPMVCEMCGACVYKENAKLHGKFHDRLQAVEDVVQP